MFKDLLKRYALLSALVALMAFMTIGCSDDNTNDPGTVNEADLLVQYLEGTDVKPSPMINNVPFMIKSSDVYTADETVAIIDIRSSEDFGKGHIKNAVNVPLKDLITYYKTNNLASKSKVAIVCYSGQTACFGASAMRMSGFDNVYAMKWGMSSWNPTTDSWSAKTSNKRATEFEATDHAKPAAGNMPTLSTGKTTGKEIADVQIQAVLDGGFAKISNDEVFANPSQYFVLNFWPQDRYTDPGHIPGAYCYNPKGATDTDLLSTTFLKTLPTDKTIVVYCYTGQTSAYVAAYLRVLGYDAKSLLYGCNAMIYDELKTKGWTIWNAETEQHDYETVN